MSKTVYACQQCGAQAPKWLGRCPDCGGWNTFAEEVFEKPDKMAAARKGAATPMGGGKAQRYADVEAVVSARFST
ncbi:MAG: DNA repair protein RadA, partial [Acidobacteria bacterium]|nr:DNA repair protein RadA [Acidobacteriota bacterium]